MHEVDPLQVLSVAWLVIPVGLLVAACVSLVALRLQGQQQQAVPGYEQAVLLHGEATTHTRSHLF